jgi:hypothetical protein
MVIPDVNMGVGLCFPRPLMQAKKNAALRDQTRWSLKCTAGNGGLNHAQVHVARRRFRRVLRPPAFSWLFLAA